MEKVFFSILNIQPRTEEFKSLNVSVSTRSTRENFTSSTFFVPHRPNQNGALLLQRCLKVMSSYFRSGLELKWYHCRRRAAASGRPDRKECTLPADIRHCPNTLFYRERSPEEDTRCCFLSTNKQVCFYQICSKKDYFIETTCNRWFLLNIK